MTRLQVSRPLFKVGDRVVAPFGGRAIVGVVVEDHGAIGMGRRRLYRVRLPMDPLEPDVQLYPEESLRPFDAATDTPPPLTVDEKKSYLARGGLLSMLRTNVGGGGAPPATWLCRDTLGNVTHTFYPERGLVGGQVAPFLAFEGEHVFEASRAAVLDFIQSFELSRADAEEVLARVGVRP